jgi:thymidylate synthase
MLEFELNYISLVTKVLNKGERRQTRNGGTRSLFAQQLVVDMSDNLFFPLLMGRQMFYKGVFGELAAILRGPKHIDDFKKWGCNYWDKWAKPDGSINVDYGNAWLEGGQIEHLKDCLANNHTDRRILIDGWRPERLKYLDLPCCHYAYQLYVTADRRLHMMWHQRSVDVMVGLPSDIVFAAAWLIMIANEFNLKPGIITMTLGDTHIYEGHVEGTYKYLSQANQPLNYAPTYKLNAEPGKDFLKFEPSDIVISDYNPMPKIGFELYE